MFANFAYLGYWGLFINLACLLLLDLSSTARNLATGLVNATSVTTDGANVAWAEGFLASRRIYVQRLNEATKHPLPALPGGQGPGRDGKPCGMVRSRACGC